MSVINEHRSQYGMQIRNEYIWKMCYDLFENKDPLFSAGYIPNSIGDKHMPASPPRHIQFGTKYPT
jgi:hypothetical protein